MRVKVKRAVFRLQHAEAIAVELAYAEVLEQPGAVRRLREIHFFEHGHAPFA
ncbi:MAG: hypothetical protein LBB75_04440 [Oscillospiraceae bacterium]|nr:hypothetical protein [Oscillospiraceae bacterium]